MGTDSEAEWGRFIAEGTGTAAGDDLLGRMLRFAYPAHTRALDWIKDVDTSSVSGRNRLAWHDEEFHDAMSDIMPRSAYRCYTISGLIRLVRADENNYVTGMTRIMDTVESSLGTIRAQWPRDTYIKSVTRMIIGGPPHPGDDFQVAWGRMILNGMVYGSGSDMGDTPLGTIPGPDLLDAIMEPSVCFAMEDMRSMPAPVSPATVLLTMSDEDGTVEYRVRKIKELEERLQIAIAHTVVGDDGIRIDKWCSGNYNLMPFGFRSLETLAGLDPWRAALLIRVPSVIRPKKGMPIQACQPSMTGRMDAYIASTDWMAPPAPGRMLGTLSDMLTDPVNPCNFDNSGTLRKAMDSMTGITHGTHRHPPGTPADMLLWESEEDPDIVRSFMALNDLMGPVLAEHHRPIMPLSALIGASDDLDDGLPGGFVAQGLAARTLPFVLPGHRACAPRMGDEEGSAPFIIDIDS